MDKTFGKKLPTAGAHIASNDEWNNIMSAITQVSVGDNNFTQAEVSEQGTQLPYDSFFFTHIASIEWGNLEAVIGKDREEDFYPYVDAVNVPAVLTTDYLIKNGYGDYEFQGNTDTQISTVGVYFQTASSTEPVKPADNSNSAIVGYQWLLAPIVTSVSFSDDGSVMTVNTQWTALADFDSDPQAGLYSVDSGSDPSSWATSSENDVLNYETYEDLINDYLGVGNEISLESGTNTNIYYKNVRIPVAAYQWDVDQAFLSRVVQLYFGGSPSANIGNSRSANPFVFDHPFKGEVTNYKTITIGSNRGAAGYKFKDSITITDPDTDDLIAINFAAAENIALDTSDYYVYYDCYKNGSVWEADLEKSTVWPPTATSPGNIVKLIGYAASTNNGSTDTYIWGQEMFDCPNEQPANLRGEFEPWYEQDGSVTVNDGTVETFNNDSATVSGGTYPLATPIDLWVEISSTASATTPNVAITSSLQTGSFPGVYVSVSDSVKKFNYKIGTIASGKYEPAHKGRLHIDNTLLQPLITDSYETLVNSPRLMEFHTTQPATVGDNTNDDLIFAKILDMQVRGGGIEQLREHTDIRMYGKTADVPSTSLLDMVVTDGASFGDGKITFTPKLLEKKWDRGLVQTHEITDDTNVEIQAGEGIQIDTDVSGNAVINGRPVTQITVVTDTQLQSDGCLQKKTRTAYVVDPGTESAWLDAGNLLTITCDISSGTEAQVIQNTSDIAALQANAVLGKPNLANQYRMTYVTSAGTITESSTIVTDASGNLGVTGNITVTGTVDGIDIATNVVLGKANLTTQYRMAYVNSSGTLTESSSIVTDASGNLNVNGDGEFASKVFINGATASPSSGEELGIAGGVHIVKSGRALTIDSGAVTGAYQRFETNGSVMGFVGAADVTLSPSGAATDLSIVGSTNLILGTGTTPAITIDSSQNAKFAGWVGIATTSAYGSEKLGVNGSIHAEAEITIKEITTPTALTNYGKIYTKTDNKLYFQDGAGTEHEIAFV